VRVRAILFLLLTGLMVERLTFPTPSRNIIGDISAEQVRCDIATGRAGFHCPRYSHRRPL
jgi:hypothetical protein